MREEFVEKVNGGLSRMYEIDPVNPALRTGAFVHRTVGDIEHVIALSHIEDSLIDSWRNRNIVDQRALRYTKPLLRMGFRYQSKNNAFHKK